jgi:hypothetical protein
MDKCPGEPHQFDGQQNVWCGGTDPVTTVRLLMDERQARIDVHKRDVTGCDQLKSTSPPRDQEIDYRPPGVEGPLTPTEVAQHVGYALRINDLLPDGTLEN